MGVVTFGGRYFWESLLLGGRYFWEVVTLGSRYFSGIVVFGKSLLSEGPFNFIPIFFYRS